MRVAQVRLRAGDDWGEMTINIGGLTPSQAAFYTHQAAACRSSGAPDAAQADAVRLDMIPASPPPEVKDAIAHAATAPDRLAAQNRDLSFKLDERTGRVHVEVRDLDGHLLFTAPASKALDVADGGNPD